MADLPPRRPIRQPPPRWKPNPNPASIDVPGLDTTASVTDQIEQIEQLITLKLQNIDENFATIHSLLMNKILPAIKRYGTATEPAREAAKFWTSFYEQAAQIRIPAYDDYETVHEDPSVQAESEASAAPPPVPESPAPSEVYDEPSTSRAPQSQYDQSMASTEMSFAPAQAAVSSTPARQRAQMANTTQSTDSSWAASLESPMVRMSRDLRSLAEEDERSRLNVTATQERTFIPTSVKGKEREEPILRSILRNKTYMPESTTPALYASPSRSRQKIKTPIPAHLNPFTSRNPEPQKWNGVVDLGQAGLATPRRGERTNTAADDDSDDDDLPPGMSPPVLMSPARAPRSVRRTPGRMAVDRITRDLVSDVQRAERGYQYGYQYESRTETSVSSMPSVPSSLSRYHQQQESQSSVSNDTSLESMMQRMEAYDDRPYQQQQHQQQPHDELEEAETSFGDVAGPIPLNFQRRVADDDSDSDDDDLIDATVQPGAAFMMASNNAGDDSFDSISSRSSSDSMDDEMPPDALAQPVHPFARQWATSVDDDSDSDSSSDEGVRGDTSTLFGARAGPLNVRQSIGPDGNLRMLGEELLEDTIGYGQVPGMVPESPSPAGEWPVLGRRGIVDE
ncbi:DASH complex subunit Ask1-domain-containing protein [Schizophyllum commune]